MADWMRVSARLLASAGVCACAGLAWADDLSPPPWRGAPGSTVQHWDFSGGPGGGPPDALPFFNPYGVPALTPGPGATWFPVGPPGGPPPPVRPSVWGVAGPPGFGLVFTVPNAGPAMMPKLIRVQMTFLDVIPDGVVGVPVLGTIPLGAPSSVTLLPDLWTHATWDLTLPFCPPLETFAIGSPAGATCFIDQIVTDTVCIPTPGSGALGAAGGVILALGGRRRR